MHTRATLTACCENCPNIDAARIMTVDMIVEVKAVSHSWKKLSFTEETEPLMYIKRPSQMIHLQTAAHSATRVSPNL